ncbi:MAG: hypothetical protein KDJ16_12995, partial [Hyphomicrobiales bacterium]|nr:hypothetical protein [Hyphomicrobiales bacterium]
VVVGLDIEDYHVLGLMAGLRDFIADPLGQGLGIGGNLSSSVEGRLDWSWAQETGATAVPVESAVGVLLYQMGVGSFVLFGFLYALTRKCRQLYLATGNSSFLFGFVAIVGISTNAVLQEEAFYSPLALGLCLVFVAYTLGNHFKSTTSRTAALTAPPPVADGTPLDGSWAGSRPFGDRSGSFAAKTF